MDCTSAPGCAPPLVHLLVQIEGDRRLEWEESGASSAASQPTAMVTSKIPPWHDGCYEGSLLAIITSHIP
jgi:hypothetical protein